MFRLSFYPVFDSYLMVAVVALLLVGLLWVGPNREKASGIRRAVLVVLRAAVIALIVLAMLRPTLIYTQTKKQAATLIVMADRSRSMTVHDAVGDKTRWEALRTALADAAPALKALSQDFELKAYTFDVGPHEAQIDGGEIELPEKPDGNQTAIGASLKKILDNEAGKRLLGVVLLSDGAQRAYAPNDLPPQIVAARLKHLGYPLFTLPFGQSQGLGEAKDVAVKDLIVSPTVFVKNELAVSGQIRIDGYVNVDIPVRVLFETSPGNMEVVGETKIKATADGQLLPVNFNYAPQTPGDYKLTLEVAKQPGELVTTNNELSTFIRVLKGGLNVLYIEGALRVEQKFIRRALASSPEINVDCVRLDPLLPQSRPADFADRFKPGKYDAYILGDVDATAFQGDELARLADCVNRGAGLIAIGGFHAFGPGRYDASPLADVLPVGMNRLERQQPNEPARTELHWPGPLEMRPTELGRRHFIMTLSGNAADNAALWAKLPPLEGANKLHDLAPDAMVLADAGEDKPLLVAGNYGSGRVLAFAADSTWRWWMLGDEAANKQFVAAHKRFWRQIVLWLARKDAAQEGNVWVRMSQQRIATSQRAEFFVGANAPTGDPIADAEFKAEIVPPSGVRRPLALVRQGNQMTGTFAETQAAGDYAIEVTATEKGQPLGAARGRFLVFQQDLELDNASADAATLENLATMTGGHSLAPEQLPELIRSLIENTHDLEVQQETKKTFWDTWTFFLTIVGLLTVEWYIRKRLGLV
jgi:uncharacterized membrane protein